MSTEGRPERKDRGQFTTTRWSLVLEAGESGSDRSERALAELCERYWYPLYAYVRRRGHDTDDARDLTQAFFAKLLEKRDLRVADPRRGRFRTFLLASMKNFLAGEWRRESTLRRGGGVELLSLDFDSAEARYEKEPAHDLTPEAIYERRWAFRLLEQAVADLRNEYGQSGKLELFDALKGFLGSGEQILPYAELSRRFGQSEGALRTAVSRLRTRWRERLRQLVAETVESEAELREEMDCLIASVGPQPPSVGRDPGEGS
jgi:RNA polymerase sigma-70 factor (ECF subfamily)